MKSQQTNLKKPVSDEAGFFYSYDCIFFQTPKNTSSKELV
ncbi:hypothetical protein HMPREF9396_0833 [Streptococcus sanguinis SK1059]|nr:hypothetical protein HMPREF9396_0833 [Streptococcus sanguinis SK1059]EGQ20646.1 hypothetical protein HMPREF8573_0823 [Streptococcus sanguinis ATCC 29667]EGQ23814.1 hypothetical protein HMPREF9387_1379 [Streptococcus sanguinis SK340]